jgi:hypothetical protein
MNETHNDFELRCDCGCGKLQFTRWEDDKDFALFIEYFYPMFYAKQQNIFSVLVERLKFVWFILRGKEYSLYDLVLTEDDLKRFKEWVASL